MDLEKWAASDLSQGMELVNKALKGFFKGHRIRIFDLAPQYENLKDKSYAVLDASPSIDMIERYPHLNLGFLLKCGFYDKIILPLFPYLDRTTFELRYGLFENRGACLNFEQFLSLIKDGKIHIAILGSPSKFKHGFYKEIFKSCKELPPFLSFRINRFQELSKLVSLAASERIPVDKSWREKTYKMYPEYSLSSNITQVEQILDEYLDTYIVQHNHPSKKVGVTYLGSRLHDLRIFGFEKLADFALRCIRLDQEFGTRILTNYADYLTTPLLNNLGGFENYAPYDVEIMSFLSIIPRSLEAIWKEAITYSLTSSSLTSDQVNLNTVELKGLELLKLIENLSDDDNIKNLKANMVNMNKSLGEFDVRSAEMNFEKIDEIITESINSEIKEYEKKGRVSRHLLRCGKTFVAMAKDGAKLFAGLMAGSGRFDWAGIALGGAGASTWIHEKLKEIKAKDIVRWWSKKWPFEDPGVGFIYWEKTHKNT